MQLASVGNPDMGQDPNRPLPGVPSVLARVRDWEEASRVCRAYLDRHGLGGGNWAGGEVLDGAGVVVARVSYNGRVWPAGEWAPGRVCLYSPGA